MKLTTKNIDHLSLVAGMCDEMGISEMIDKACGDQARKYFQMLCSEILSAS